MAAEDEKFPSRVRLLYEQDYVITCVGNLAEQKLCISTFEYPSGNDYRYGGVAG
jgi:hypothetical protein